MIADDSADPALVACDLLGQAEHDPASGVCLVCMSEAFARAAIVEVERQLAVLPTREVAAALVARQRHRRGRLRRRGGRADLRRLRPRAPRAARARTRAFFAERLTSYGSLFIGEETTVAYGDKTIGTNHILPTSRAARYTGGLWVGKFLKTCTYQRMTPAASREVGEVTERQCIRENMLAHGITARLRVERFGRDRS